MSKSVRSILERLRAGEITVEDALLRIKATPFENIGFAKVDIHRQVRQGAPEVIYGAGKTVEQIADILASMKKDGQDNVIVTRLSPESAAALANKASITYYEVARIALVGGIPKPDGAGSIVVATGGTSDIPVAEEAAITAEALGNRVERLYDVGVAGLHRLLHNLETIMNANVIVAVAGMEGALASVIGGLADCPVIAVPTSVGYGAAFGGLAALLSMLNSCSSGVSVVNIDNGFGAGYLASMINHPKGGIASK